MTPEPPPILRDATLPADLLERVHGAAAALRDRGVRTGDRVAVDARAPADGGGPVVADPQATLAWFLGADLLGAARGRSVLDPPRARRRARRRRSDVLVCDQPTTLLDLRHKRHFVERLGGLRQQVLLLTHDLDLLDGFDRVIVLAERKVVADDGPGPAVAHYRDLYR